MLSPEQREVLKPLVQGLPPIAMLSTCTRGGASIAALNLHAGLLATGLDVTLLTLANSYPRTPSIRELPQGARLYVSGVAMRAAALRAYPAMKKAFPLFSVPRSPVRFERERLREYGLLHLQWVTGMVDFSRTDPALLEKPMLRTMHDMEPFTGGCHYTGGCKKYRLGCADCPQLGVPSVAGHDLAAQSFVQKARVWRECPTSLCAPCDWLAACARDGTLLRGARPAVIPNCVDTTIFRPELREEGRRRLGVAPDRTVVCFGAYGISERNKGLHVVVMALNWLRRERKSALPLLVVFGGGSLAGEWLPQGYECRLLGPLEDRKALAAVYAASDLFLCPSFQDVAPLTALEAQACGTPCLGFRGTGVEEEVVDGITGFVARHPGLPLDDDGKILQDPPYAVPEAALADMVEKLQHALELSEDERKQMRYACRARAEEKFSIFRHTRDYLALYRTVLGL